MPAGEPRVASLDAGAVGEVPDSPLEELPLGRGRRLGGRGELVAELERVGAQVVELALVARLAGARRPGGARVMDVGLGGELEALVAADAVGGPRIAELGDDRAARHPAGVVAPQQADEGAPVHPPAGPRPRAGPGSRQ